MISVVIMVVLIIILALVVFNNSRRPIEQASEVKIKSELVQVGSGVAAKRLANSKEGTSEKIVNRGFIKVYVMDAPETFVSFDKDNVTGYVVDLSTIEYTDLQYGRGYLELVTGDTVTFNVDDVYLYDAAGNVYYAKGYMLENGEQSYTSGGSTDRIDGPDVKVISTENGNIELEVTPKNGGTISSVVIGDKLANTTDGFTYTLTVTRNGTYVVIATEEGGGSTRITLTVTTAKEIEGIAPEITDIHLSENKKYTNKSVETIYIIAENAEYIAIQNNNPTPPQLNDSRVWKKYAETSQVSLSEGKNTIYVWAKSADNIMSSDKSIEIILDTVAPSKNEPTYSMDAFTITVVCNQTDANPITVEYGYKRTADSSFTYQESSTIQNLAPGETYVIVTKAKDAAGNESVSNSVTTNKIENVPSDITITCKPDGWAESKEVTINYPNTYGVGSYQNIYRTDGGEWKNATSDQEVITVISNSKVDAAVSVKLNNGELVTSPITSIEVTQIDRLAPFIAPIEGEKADISQEGYDLTTTIMDDGSGLVAWTVTKEPGEPNTWDNVFAATNETVTAKYKANENSEYYFWAKDAIGKTACESILVGNIDTTDPVIKQSSIAYGEGNAKFVVVAQDQNLGLSAYAVVKGEGKKPEESDWKHITQTTDEYKIEYTVEDNGYYTVWVRDVSGKTASVSKNIKVKFKVTYDYRTNGGESISIKNNVVELGCNMGIDLTPTATKSNATFIGWNTDPNATQGLASYTIGTVEDVTIYAIFKNTIEVNIIYYDGQELKRETFSKDIYNTVNSATIEIPNIETTYTGWVKMGYTTSKENTGKVEYSGDNIKIETNKSLTLYMMYRRNIATVYRYYASEKVTDKNKANTYTYVDKDNNGYYITSIISSSLITTNSYNIDNTTKATTTVPTVQTTVKNQSEKEWTFRGFSESSASDTEALISPGTTVSAMNNITYYASYKTELVARKFLYGSTTPETIKGNATMSYNAVINPAVIELGSADDVTYKNNKWEILGWSLTPEVTSEVSVLEGSVGRITKDTDYYSIYQRDIRLIYNLYANQVKDTTQPAYLNYLGETKKAQFVLDNISTIMMDSIKYAGRGYSSLNNLDAEIELSANDIFETDEDKELFASYYNNITVIKEEATMSHVIDGTVLVGYDGSIKEAEINLGDIEDTHYNGYSWKGTYWSNDYSDSAEEIATKGSTVKLKENATFYAVYTRDITVTENIYGGKTTTLNGVAKLNASGAMKAAEIGLNSTESVIYNGSTWDLKNWSSSRDPNNKNANLVNKNESVHLYEDAEYFAMYGKDVNIEVYYLDEAAQTTKKDLSGTALLSYAGELTADEGAVLPSVNSVTIDEKIWTPVGFLSSADGCTIDDYTGTKTYIEGEIVSASEEVTYYTIYQSTIRITKVDKVTSLDSYERINMNSAKQKLSVEITLGPISDYNEGNKIWRGYGWSLTKGNSQNPEIKQDQKIQVSEDSTYYAAYSKQTGIELHEFESVGKDKISTVETTSYMDSDGVKSISTVTIPAPSNLTVTNDDLSWNFIGWSSTNDTNDEIELSPNSAIQIQDETVLYAKYNRQVSIKEIIYGNNNFDTKQGNAIMNSLGEIKGATIALDIIQEQNVDDSTWTGRGWSTSELANAGENYVNSNGSITTYKDMDLYASYYIDVTIIFNSYDGDNIIAKKKVSTAYMNHAGNIIDAFIVVPSVSPYIGWTPDGYTTSTNTTVNENERYTGIIEVHKDMILNALYYKVITITFDVNGGAVMPNPITGKVKFNVYDVGNIENLNVTIPAQEPSKNGYNFVTWTEEQDFIEEGVTTYTPGETYIFDESKTLYAFWEPKQYTITYDAMGGTFDKEPQTKLYDEAIQIYEEEPVLEGKTFLGWGIIPNSKQVIYYAGDYYTDNMDITLYAIYE